MERIVENTTLIFQLKLNNFIGEKKINEEKTLIMCIT